MAAPSWQDLYDAGKAEALIRRPKARIEPGTRYDMLISGAAACGDLLIGYTADRVKAFFVDGARGTDLSILADDRYGLQRISAVASVGQVTFVRTSPIAVARTLPTGTKIATDHDAQGNEIDFVTTAPASWGSSVGGAVTVAAQASVAGTDGNIPAGAITRILDATPEAFTVSNALLFAGGAEAETDEALRVRMRGFSATIRRGTRAALEFGALTVPGVAKATATEDSTGAVSLYVTDASGGANPTLVAAVVAEIENWRAVGARVIVIGGTLLSIDVTIALVVRAGSNAAVLLTAVQAAVTSRINLLQIGEIVYRSAILQAIRNVDPDNIVEATVTLRTGADPFLPIDIAPAGNQIPRAGVVSVA